MHRRANRDDMELLLSGGKTPPDAEGNKKQSPRFGQWKDVPGGKQLRALWSA